MTAGSVNSSRGAFAIVYKSALYECVRAWSCAQREAARAAAARWRARARSGAVATSAGAPPACAATPTTSYDRYEPSRASWAARSRSPAPRPGVSIVRVVQ